MEIYFVGMNCFGARPAIIKNKQPKEIHVNIVPKFHI